MNEGEESEKGGLVFVKEHWASAQVGTRNRACYHGGSPVERDQPSSGRGLADVRAKCGEYRNECDGNHYLNGECLSTVAQVDVHHRRRRVCPSSRREWRGLLPRLGRQPLGGECQHRG